MDTSIFDNEKESILQLLNKYKKVEISDAVIFEIDEEMNNIIVESSRLLTMEYGEQKNALNKYTINHIVKFLNPDNPTASYSVSKKKFWKQVNERTKVLNRLDAEFVIWSRRLLKEVTSKIKTKNVSPQLLKEKRESLNEEIKEKELVLEYIKEHYDELDVVISAFHTKPSWGVVARFTTISDDMWKEIRLKTTTVNAIFIDKKVKHDKIYAHNKLIHFFKKATHAYGDVYFKPLEEPALNISFDKHDRKK